MKTLVKVILIMILITSLSSDEVTLLNANISDFQVNDDQDNATREAPSILVDRSGNFIITWADFKGDGNIYAQRYSSDGTALGSNFQVNDIRDSVAHQRNGGVASSIDKSGNFIIVWNDLRKGDGEQRDIYAQRYSSDGTALGSNFKVNDDIDNTWQHYPSISIDGSGNFIIAWDDSRNDYDIYAQRYSSDGTALGSNFRVNDDIGSAEQNMSSISANGSGNFIITWHDGRNDHADIYAQRYSSDGTVLGSNFRVNDDEVAVDQLSPSVSADSIGNFIITWTDKRSGHADIYAQRYSSDGTALGSNFKVSDDQGSVDESNPSISADGNGNFIIAWTDERNGDQDIYAQRYSNEGTMLLSNFKVNDDQGSSNQRFPSISADKGGNFIITWEDERNGNEDIYAQRYSSDGTALGSNFKVNEDQGIIYQSNPSISADVSGNFIITWYDHRNGDADIYAQQYASDGTALGSNFKVNDDQGSAGQNHPSISADNSGNFIITWRMNAMVSFFMTFTLSDMQAMEQQ